MAQLGARFHGMEEVIGSIPIRSTKYLNNLQAISGNTSKNLGTIREHSVSSLPGLAFFRSVVRLVDPADD